MKKHDGGQRYIFVGGAPRSGTTLVQNMLDSHPDIYGTPEFKHLPRIIEMRRAMHMDVQDGVIDDICSHEEVDYNIRALIDSFLMPLVERHECRLLSEKTPENILVFDGLIELFPQAHFFHVVRDPRAVISSLFEVAKKARGKGDLSYYYCGNTRAAIKHTKLCLKNGFKASMQYPDKVMTVVYEQLVHDPRTQTERMCRFLHLPWSEKMLVPGETAHPAKKAMTCERNSIWYDEEMFTRNPVKDSLEKWQDVLSLTDRIRIASAFMQMDELRNLGYDLPLKGMPAVWRTVAGAKANLQRSIRVKLRWTVERLLRL
jgi:protein-tyrosine sulfotransferase